MPSATARRAYSRCRLNQSRHLRALCRLSVWLLKLGGQTELIEPGKLHQNGRHERMRRTLKDETLRPPAAAATAQQRKFYDWRREFNASTRRTRLELSRSGDSDPVRSTSGWTRWERRTKR